MPLSFIKKQNILTYFFICSLFISSLSALFLYIDSTKALTNAQKIPISFEENVSSKENNIDIAVSESKDVPKEVQEGLQEEAVAVNITTLSGYVLQENELLTRSQVQAKDTISTILKDCLSYAELTQIIKLAKPYHNLTNIQDDRKYHIVRDSKGNFLRFEYEKNKEEVFVLSVKDTQKSSAPLSVQDTFEFSVQAIAFETKVATVEMTIASSLYNAVAQVGEKRSLAFSIEKILANSAEYSGSLKKGDIFKVLVEKKFDGDTFVSYGNILAISFNRKGKSFAVYKFGEDTKQNAYYAANGKTLQSSFLDKPLNYTRISSPYTLARRHPILGTVRAHEGIDYAAPSGTPVYAVADATVAFVGYKGDFGKTVILKHANGIQTQYAHLSRFNAKTRKNTKVSKGDIIAYVGSTGLSTGPHLDFRVKKSGQYVNPKVLASVKGTALTEEQKEAFLLTVSAYNVALNNL